MAEQERYQRMVVSTLARKLGPAAADFAQDMAARTGLRFADLSPANVEGFAANVETHAVRYIPAADARFVANVIRKLQA